MSKPDERKRPRSKFEGFTLPRHTMHDTLLYDFLTRNFALHSLVIEIDFFFKISFNLFKLVFLQV